MLIHFNDYQGKALQTCNPNLSKKDMLINGILGLNGELSETITNYFARAELDDPNFKEDITNEFGDVYWYIALISFALDIPANGLLDNFNIEKYEDAVYRYIEKKENLNDIFKTKDCYQRAPLKNGEYEYAIHYSGLITDTIKKVLYQGHELTEETLNNIKIYLMNLVFCLALWHTRQQIPLFWVLNFNLYKLSQRYPNGFDSEHSINRKEES